MAVFLISTIKGATTDQYDRAVQKVLVSNWPNGLIHHFCASSDDGFTVLEEWESEQAIQALLGSEKFRRDLESEGIPQPDMRILPVHNELHRS